MFLLFNVSRLAFLRKINNNKGRAAVGVKRREGVSGGTKGFEQQRQ